jgi:hypothetical protein
VTPSPEELAERLRPLVGQPLWAARRSQGLHSLQLGEQLEERRRNGRPVRVGRYSLHVLCPWRILAQGKRVVVGSGDRSRPRGNPAEVPADFSPATPGATLCDERMEALLASHASSPLVVTAASADVLGAFRLALTGGLTLEVFPDGSAGEHWRLIERVEGAETQHFVVSMEP